MPAQPCLAYLLASPLATRSVPSALCQQCFQGSGKSTTLNCLLRRLIQTDETLAAAYLSAKPFLKAAAASAADAPPPPFVLRDDFTRGDRLQAAAVDSETKAAIKAAEDALEAAVFSKGGQYNKVVKKMNQLKEDVLPTGSGTNALTALVTTIELDPAVSAVTLKITYRSEEEVQEVLEAAESIRTQIGEHREREADPDPDDHAVELDGERDVSLYAHKACAIMNIPTSSGNAVDKIGEFEGPFELPPHFSHLLGRERTLSIHGSDGATLLTQLNKWLMLHTVGTWSHWGAVLKASSCVGLPATSC